MEQAEQVDKNSFLYPRHRYHGQFKLENLVFDANLQEFVQRVSYIYNLENGGKLSPQEAYSRVEALWEEYKASCKGLGF
jgi:hypothetical protein